MRYELDEMFQTQLVDGLYVLLQFLEITNMSSRKSIVYGSTLVPNTYSWHFRTATWPVIKAKGTPLCR